MGESIDTFERKCCMALILNSKSLLCFTAHIKKTSRGLWNWNSHWSAGKTYLCPAPENTGVYFVRKDLPGCPALKAQAEFVQATTMATTMGGDIFSVATIEHCLSSLAALRIDNLFIELDGPEIPIGDGSAQIF